MIVLNGTAAGLTSHEARPGVDRHGVDRVDEADAGAETACREDGAGEAWYYISSGDRYVRRIEREAPDGSRINHIVLSVENVAGVISGGGVPPTSSELGARNGTDAVSVTYGPGADPVRAAITVGSASVLFDPRTIADVVVWTRDLRNGQRRQGRYTWDHAARGGAGAFVLAGPVGSGRQSVLDRDAR